jgi:benzodiazapine receptor
MRDEEVRMQPWTLLRTASAVAATAVTGGLATDPRSPWYRSLRKPRWQPPPPAYGLVWTPLYADLAVTSARALDRLAARGSGERAAYRAALAANLVLNAGWNVVFFRARRPWLAAAECAVLTVSAADLVRRTAVVDRRAALALAPYSAWCAFATALTIAIARRN